MSNLQIVDNVDDKKPYQLYVIDGGNPEDMAMMQALYSRSAQSVTTHIAKVQKSGSGKFMESFYVGYGHESIGDCGSTTIFIENVSILAAKAIQDWQLYSGQETSTRYIDMSKQSITDPINTPESKEILDKWMQFYNDSQEPLKEYLKGKYPRGTNESVSVYNKAIAARAFDILRAFLPAGVNTQLAWHTNLRQAANKLGLLAYHPDPVIREVGESILALLQKKYPHSFCHKKYPETETYRKNIIANHFYFTNNIGANDLHDEVCCQSDIVDLKEYQDIISTRPAKTELPSFLADLGNVQFNFLLDYGSFRDLQRHRNGVCRMPLLTTQYGFHNWYLDQMPQDMRATANSLIRDQVVSINNNLHGTDIQKQYYIPLGFRVACQVTYGLPAAVYTIELRSGKTVHATLREVALKMMHALQEKHPNLIFHCDTDPDEWDIRRGLQDITEKVQK
uniref:Thymidylate synthase n=1 Tax=viral metagenome TaxID=1070528 RepID=A0A6C0JW85_9ZZZZ